jgi:hypothetical protein
MGRVMCACWMISVMPHALWGCAGRGGAGWKSYYSTSYARSMHNIRTIHTMQQPLRVAPKSSFIIMHNHNGYIFLIAKSSMHTKARSKIKKHLYI